MTSDTANTIPVSLSSFDWCMVGLYAAIMVGAGWKFGRDNQNADDFIVGARRMNPISVGLSYFVAIFSTITYLALPGEMIRHGPVILGGLIGFPFVYLMVGRYVIPAFMGANISSAYEVLDFRLGASVRLLGVAIFLVMRILWMAVILFATVDKVVMPLTNWPASATPYVLLLVASLAILYASMGGLKAIVAIDVMQCCLLFGGVFVSLGLITWRLGGIEQWWPREWPAHWQPISLLPSESSNRSIIAAACAIFCLNASTAGSDQMAVQRYLATRSTRSARQMLAISMVSACGIQFILGCLGLAIYAYFSQSPQSTAMAIDLEHADQLFPRFIATGLPTGIAGLMIAGLLAEALNSLASGINASSAVIFTDLLRWKGSGDNAPLRSIQLTSIATGVCVVALSVLVSLLEGNLLEITFKLVNLLAAPLFSLFFLAIFVPMATPAGAFAGALAGIAAATVVNYWTPLAALLVRLTAADLSGTEISFLWATPLSLVTAIVVGVGVSSVWPSKSRQ